MSAPRPRVAVVGGGIIGCASAWRLARAGAEVVLLERDEPGIHASSAAAGMLSPLKEAEEPGPFLELGLRSLDRYPDFVREVEAASGMDVEFRQDGRLDVALDDAAAAALRRHQRMQAEAGHESRLLQGDELRRIAPGVTPDAVLALSTDHDYRVDNARLVRALWIAASREGARLRTGVAVEALETHGGKVTGVRLSGGEAVPADAVVVAAGAWSGRIDLPRRLPIRPVRGQIVVLRSVPPVLGRTTWGPGVYLVPRMDGRLLVGSTMEEAGYSARVTAGAVERLLRLAARIAPSLADAPIEGFQVGLRPAAADGLPVIGRDPDVEGLVFATGHFRNGILLAPETAERVVESVLRDAVPETAFDPARFGG